MPPDDPMDEEGPRATGPAVPAAAATPRAIRAARSLRRLAVDLGPLRSSRDFRLLWSSLMISEAGHQITRVAVYVHVYRLTGSLAAVGLVGIVELVPLVLATVLGGPLIDAFDRRKVLLFTQVGYAAAATLLLLTALSPRAPVGLVYLGAGLMAGIGGIDSPTRSAMTPRLVGREQVPAAIALFQVMWNTTMMVGPALGGLVIARSGLPWAYGIDAVTYGATFAAAALIRPVPPETAPSSSGRLAAIREGWSYLRGRRVLQSTFAIDLIAMIFGMPRALFPALAITQFHRGAQVTGLLFAAPAVGALIGALTTGWVGRVRHQGRAVVWAVAAWGAGIVAFGIVGGHLWLAMVFLAVAGAADVISAVFRSSILQLSVPDQLRGRLSAIHILVVTGGPRLGDVEAGVVGQVFTPTVSVITGGLACIVGTAILAVVVPQLWRYHAGEPG